MTHQRIAAALVLASLASCGQPAEQGRVYVTSGFTDQVFVLDAADGALVDTLRLDPRREEADEPHGVAVSADGMHWYATLSHGEPTLWKFESTGNRLVGRLRLDQGGASRIGITPDDSLAFVPDYHRSGQGAVSQLTVVRLHDLSVVSTLALCAAPHHALPSPTGGLIAVTCPLSDEIVLVDRSSLQPVRRVPVGVSGGESDRPSHRPMNVAWHPSGQRMFVSLMSSGRVAAFGSDGGPLGTARIGGAPAQLATTPDGRTLVVASRTGFVSILDSEALVERARVTFDDSDHPHGVAVHPGGRTAYVALEGSVQTAGAVVAIDLAQGEVLWRRPAGIYALGIAWGPGG